MVWDRRPEIARILGTFDSSDVERAFTLPTDPDGYHSLAEVAIRKQDVRIEGAFFKGDVEVGEFARTLRYEHGRALAFHDFIEIAEPHRLRGLATEHYASAIRFYDRSPIRRIEMMAAGYGPETWPQFGFDLSSRYHKERLRAIAVRVGFRNVPDLVTFTRQNLRLQTLPEFRPFANWATLWAGRGFRCT